MEKLVLIKLEYQKNNFFSKKFIACFATSKELVLSLEILCGLFKKTFAPYFFARLL